MSILISFMLAVISSLYYYNLQLVLTLLFFG